MKPRNHGLILNCLYSFSRGVFCCEQKALSVWDQDKAPLLASSEIFLAGPLTESACFHVGGQAGKHLK